jgi:hypothetical protein
MGALVVWGRGWGGTRTAAGWASAEPAHRARRGPKAASASPAGRLPFSPRQPLPYAPRSRPADAGRAEPGSDFNPARKDSTRAPAPSAGRARAGAAPHSPAGRRTCCSPGWRRSGGGGRSSGGK